MTTDDEQVLTRLWRQPPETKEDPMTIDTIRAHATAFDRRSRRQDLGSVAAFSCVVVANAIAMTFERGAIEKLGDLLAILASLYVLSYYWRAREASPASLGATPTIELYRQNILRRQAMRGRFWKVVLLFVPGIFLSSMGDALVSPLLPSRYAIVAGVFGALVVWAEWLNRREARKLAAELERAGQ